MKEAAGARHFCRRVWRPTLGGRLETLGETLVTTHHSLCMVLATAHRLERARQHAVQTQTKQNLQAVVVVSWFQIVVVVS